MNFIELWTTFDGRINRAKYWAGALVLMVILLVVWFVVAGLLFGGAGPMSQVTLQLIFLVIVIYPMTALMVKRLHDRDRPTMLVAVFWAPSIVQLLGDATGLTSQATDIGGQTVMLPNTLGWIVLGISMIVGIWALIELGILKGTDGPNQHGPDPLQQ